MGLLKIFLQNQSNLDITPIPVQGNGPIEPATGEFNTGANSFTQVWNSNNTYLNTFAGGTNTGIQPPTLAQTGLDIDDPTAIPSTTIPNTLTAYPATALGGLGQSAVQFLQIWSPVINYNNVVVGAPTSPLEQSLNETGLDVENQNAVPTTTTPNTITQYPSLASGDFGGGASQYTQNWSPTNTYLNSNFINAQEDTLDLTGLDNTNINSLPTTITPIQVSTTPQILPAQTFMGEFGGAPSQYTQIYSPNLGQGYLDNYNTIISNAGNPQILTLDETGLDIENQNAAPTTYAVPQTDNITVYPVGVTGELGDAPSPFTQEWKPTNNYYDFMKENYQAQ